MNWAGITVVGGVIAIAVALGAIGVAVLIALAVWVLWPGARR